MTGKLPSPCIGVCKFRREGHCIACSMTKPQKKLFKSLKGKHRPAFVAMLLRQQEALGGYSFWPRKYAKKCARKDVAPPAMDRGTA
ncbi:DUF1289 domain-containing protein [Acuticoccus sp.]|uniref:DUF1289 domain-containing protein n=1 Tax=Acuticoccus sp. TaxID=1904378 RepID=UPI003B52F3AE